MLKRLVVLLAAGAIAVSLSAQAVHAQNDRPTRGGQSAFVPERVIVKLNPGIDARDFARSNGLRPDNSKIEQLPNHAIFRMQIADNSKPADKAAALAHNPQVIYAEPDYLGQAPEASRRSSWAVGENVSLNEYAEQWAATKIKLPEAFAVTKGKAVVVAVLDTGVDGAHPALQGHLLPGYDFVDGDSDPSEVGVYGENAAFGHGTHVAGLVALAAPEALILPVRFLDPNGKGSNWGQAQALNYAASRGVDVINLSYTSPAPSRLIDDILSEITCAAPLSEKCRSQVRPGAVVVAAAGNSGKRIREYPAASGVPGVIAVAASTKDDGLAAFSTYGPWVQLAAPGEEILSCVPGGGYAFWSGTSMAAPLAAGVAALARSAAPSLHPSVVANQLTKSAVVIEGSVRWRVSAAGAVGLPER